MRIMKKLLLIPVIILLAGALVAGCGSQSVTTTTAATTVTTAAAPATTTTAVSETTTTAAATVSDFYVQKAVLVGTNVPTTDWHYDVPLFDPTSGQLYLADASNYGVDVWDTSSGKYVALVGGKGPFAGPAGADHFDYSQVGPNGLALDDQGLLWVGDGDGSVKVIDTKALKVVQTIVTGAAKKADALALDSADGLMLVTCPEETARFVAFIDVKTYKLVGTLKLPDAVGGMGFPAYNATTGKFYVAVTTKTGGEVDVIDPLKRAVESKIDLGKDCAPTGIVFGPGTQLLVGTAATDTMAAGSPAMIDVATGKILARLDAYAPQVGGIDMVAYDSKANRYFLADTAGIGVIDAGTFAPLPNINDGSRVIAVDSATNTVYKPNDTKGVLVYILGVQ